MPWSGHIFFFISWMHAPPHLIPGKTILWQLIAYDRYAAALQFLSARYAWSQDARRSNSDEDHLERPLQVLDTYLKLGGAGAHCRLPGARRSWLPNNGTLLISQNETRVVFWAPRRGKHSRSFLARTPQHHSWGDVCVLKQTPMSWCSRDTTVEWTILYMTHDHPCTGLFWPGL